MLADQGARNASVGGRPRRDLAQQDAPRDVTLSFLYLSLFPTLRHPPVLPPSFHAIVPFAVLLQTRPPAR